MIRAELHWLKIEKNEKFMRKEASGRRILPVQPLVRVIWNFN